MRFGKILATCAALTLAAAASPALAADANSEVEARERFNRAVELYNAGDYPSALAELNRAAAVRPSYKLLYAIAQVRVQMNDYVGAVNAYKQYLQGGGREVDDARRATVQKEIKRLEQRISALAVSSNVPGSEVYLDETLVGTTPLEAPLQVNSGQHRITVRHADYVSQSRAVSLAGGLREELVFTLAPSDAKPGAPPVSEAPTTTPSSPTVAAPSTRPTPVATPAPVAATAPAAQSSTSFPWLGWAATSALAVGAGVTGVIALSKSSKLADERDQLGATDAEISDGNR
jgi:PEGA domain